MIKEISPTATGQDLPCPADGFLPHKPPMLLVETLAERQGSRALGLATLPLGGIFVSAAGILPEYFIELIAQTAALGNCYDAVKDGAAPRDGMLVGIDSFTWPGLPQPGSPVRVETDIVFAFGAMKVVHGEVHCGGELLAAGDIKVWEDLGGDGKS